jgi:hypothetical protein
MKNAIFWDVALCRSCVNRHFRRTYRLHLQGRKICEQGNSSLQPPAHAGSLHADFSTLKMGAIRSSETSVHTRSTRRHIPEDGILHSHRNENLKSYILFLFLLIWRNMDLWHIMTVAFRNFQVPSNHVCVFTGVNNADSGKYELHSWIAPQAKLRGRLHLVNSVARKWTLSGDSVIRQLFWDVMTLWICNSTLFC